jgi:hypothetical protein
MVALGAFCMEGFNFGFSDALDGFSGCLSFDCRDLGIINCLFGFVLLLQDIIVALLLSPVVRTFNEIAGIPIIPLMRDFLGAGRPSFGSLCPCNGSYKRLPFISALSWKVDHPIVFVTMDDPWFA